MALTRNTFLVPVTASVIAATASFVMMRAGIVSRAWPAASAFLLVVSIVTNMELPRKPPPASILVAIVLKLLLSLVLLVVALILLHESFRPFAFHFLAQYVIFTTFETVHLSRKARTGDSDKA